MEREFRKKVCVLADNAATKVHQDIDDPADFDRRSWRNRLIEDTGLEQPTSISDEIERSLDARADRVLQQRRQTFSGTVHRFGFEAVLGNGFVDLAGDPPIVSSTSRWAGLKIRLCLMVFLLLLGGVAGSVIYARYVGRHAWYAMYGNGYVVAGLVFAASILASSALGSALLVRRGRSIAFLGGALAGTVAVAISAWVASGLKSPQAGVAQAALAAGQVDRARDEAQALVETRTNVPAGGQVLDEIHVRQAKLTQGRQELASLLREHWFSPIRMEEARAELVRAIERDAAAFFRTHDASSLEQLARDAQQHRRELGEGVFVLASALRAAEALTAWNAKMARDALAKLAPSSAVPSSIRPSNWDDIMAGAARLVLAFDGLGVKGIRARRKALAEVVEASRDYAATLGLDPDVVSRNLSEQLDEVQVQLVRAVRRKKSAAARKGNSEGSASVTEGDSPPYPALLGERSNSRSRTARPKTREPFE